MGLSYKGSITLPKGGMKIKKALNSLYYWMIGKNAYRNNFDPAFSHWPTTAFNTAWTYDCMFYKPDDSRTSNDMVLGCWNGEFPLSQDGIIEFSVAMYEDHATIRCYKHGVSWYFGSEWYFTPAANNVYHVQIIYTSTSGPRCIINGVEPTPVKYSSAPTIWGTGYDVFGKTTYNIGIGGLYSDSVHDNDKEIKIANQRLFDSVIEFNQLATNTNGIITQKDVDGVTPLVDLSYNASGYVNNGSLTLVENKEIEILALEQNFEAEA